MNRIKQTVMIRAKDDTGEQIIIAPLEFDGERAFVVLEEYYIKNKQTGCKDKVEVDPKFLVPMSPNLGANYLYKGKFDFAKNEMN
jgi:hypothetical protein